jgi:biopolymer transport protein ExbD
MVDMFTVLVIFLLQNYNSTGAVIFIPKEVTLPKASQIKELMPSVVVTISNTQILVDKTPVIEFEKVKQQPEWMIEALRGKVQEALAHSRQEEEDKIQQKLRTVVDSARGTPDKDINAWNKVTVQADKGIDFLTVKKVMYTITEAGAGEINFAVTKNKDQN